MDLPVRFAISRLARPHTEPEGFVSPISGTEILWTGQTASGVLTYLDD